MTTANGSRNGYAANLNASARKALVNIGQTGSPFDPMSSRLFLDYQTGGVFSATSDWDARRVRQMLASDGTSKSLEQVLSLPIRSAEVKIQPSKGDNGEAAFCQDVLGDKLDDLVDQMTSAIAYKQSFHEKVWGLNDGKLVIEEMAWRPASTCDPAWTSNGQPNGFRQRVSWALDKAAQSNSNPNPGWVTIPRERAFVYVHGRHREPLLGVSDLDVVWSSWETRQKLMFLWFQFLEGQSLPKTVAYGSGDDDAQNNAEAFASGKASAVIPMTYPSDPSAKTFEVVESSGQGAGQFIEALRYLESKAINSVLAGFTELATAANNGNGSYALSSSQSEFFLKSRQAVANEIGSSIRRDLLTQLVVANFGADAAIPTVSIGPLSDLEQERALSMLETLLVSPVVQAPRGLIEQLLMMTSQFVGIDADKLHDEIEKTRGTPDAYVSVAEARTTATTTDTTTHQGGGGSSSGGSSGQLSLPGMPGGAPAGADSEQTQLSNAIALSHELTTRAMSGEDPSDVLRSIHDRLELARYVRTEAGAKRYGVPIGSPIGAGKAVRAVKSATKDAEKAAGDVGKAGSAAKTAGRDTSKATSAVKDARSPSERLKAGTLTGPDGIGKRQTSAAKYAVTNGKQTFVAEDGSPSFDAPHGEGYTRFDPDGTAWKSEHGEEPKKVPPDELNKLLDTYLDDGKGDEPEASVPNTPKAPAAKTTPKPRAPKTRTVKPAAEEPKAPEPVAPRGEFQPADGAAVEAQMVKEARGNVTPEDRALIDGYAGATFEYVNGAMRGKYNASNLNRDRPFLSRDELDQVRDKQAALDTATKLNAVIDKFRVPKDVTVTRVVSGGRWLPKDDLSGKQIVNKGLVSTSMADSGFEGSTMFEINVPAGFHAASLEAVMSTSGDKRSATASGQHELILPHGTIFQVRSEESRNVNGRKVRVLKVDAQPPTAQTAKLPGTRS